MGPLTLPDRGPRAYLHIHLLPVHEWPVRYFACWPLQDTSALEAEQLLRRENSHLQALVEAGSSLTSRDDSVVAALQKSFNELLQEREQQVRVPIKTLC